MKTTISLLTTAIFAALSLLVARAADINVAAAASLTDALKEIAPAFEKSSGHKLVFNFAASSVLARQIEAGAPVDVFFSADEAKMDTLSEKGHLLEGTRKSLLSNTLVIVLQQKSALTIRAVADLAQPGIKRIALAEPASVPAGIYAKAYLEKTGLWDKVKDRVVPTENVRGALAAVESGNVEAAIVYKTDAQVSQKAVLAFEVPAAEGPDISYPVAAIKASKLPAEAKAFLAHLETEEALAVFQKAGFIIRKP